MSSAAAPARRAALADLACLTAALAVVFAGLSAAGWTPFLTSGFWSDARAYALPHYQYAADRIAAGKLPLWNPYEFGGLPFLASITSAVFYPPVRIVMTVLAGDAAHRALFCLHLLIGACGSLWLARTFGLGRAAAVLAALWVTQPSWLAQAFDDPLFAAGVAWVPYLLGLAWRVAHRPTARHVAMLAIVATLEFTSGYPPLVLGAAQLTLLLIGVALVDRRAGAARSPLGRTLGALLGAGLLAGLLAAAQALPTAELLAHTNRQQEVETVRDRLDTVGERAVDALNLPPATTRQAAERAWDRYGPVVIALVLAGIVLRRARASAWFVALAVALTAFAPASVYRLLPLSSFVRFGFEWTLLAPVFVYLGAALGLDALLARERLASASTLGAVFVAGTAALWGWRHVERMVAPVESLAPVAVPEEARRLCRLADSEYRAYWPIGHHFGGILSSRIASLGGYEQTLLPERSAALVDYLRIGNPRPLTGWGRRLGVARMVTERLSLRCIIAGRNRELRRAGFHVVRDEDRQWVYVNPGALPRARLARAVLWGRTPNEAAMAIRVTNPATAVVEAPPPDWPPCAPDAQDGVTTIRNDPEDLRFHVRTRCRTLLVLADTWFPGWTAAVDGEPTPILRADYVGRAVVVPAGEHEVRFEYAPASVRIGLFLSLAGVIIAALLAVRPERRA